MLNQKLIISKHTIDINNQIILYTNNKEKKMNLLQVLVINEMNKKLKIPILNQQIHLHNSTMYLLNNDTFLNRI